MTSVRGWAFLPALVLSACSKSPQEAAKEAAETIASWKATVTAVDSARLGKLVPEHFARNVRLTAIEEIAKAATQAK